MLRIISALTPSLALQLEHDLLRRADLHLVGVTTVEELVATAREGAALALIEPLLPDGNARDALEELAANEDRVPLVLIATPEQRAELGDEGFAAVIELPFSGGAFEEVLGRIVDAPRRRGRRRTLSARVLDADGQPLGRAIDLATGGIALRTRRALEVGSTLDYALVLPGMASLSARGRVVRCAGEHAALTIEAPSDALREALALLVAADAGEGLSFHPHGERTASIGGAFTDGAALSALLSHLAEGEGERTLFVRDLHPFSEDALTRFIATRRDLEGLGPLALRAVPVWLASLMSRMPSVLGDTAKVGSVAVALRCPGCGDTHEEELDLPVALKPCAICAAALEPVPPLDVALAFTDAQK